MDHSIVLIMPCPMLIIAVLHVFSSQKLNMMLLMLPKKLLLIAQPIMLFIFHLTALVYCKIAILKLQVF